MEVRSCRSCKRLFNYVGGQPICPACKDMLEKKFMDAKEYIRNNKGCGIKEVAEAIEVNPNQIKQWVKEERLEFSADSTDIFTCEQCGIPIRTGRLCKKCKEKMVDNLEGLYRTVVEPAKKKQDGNKMRFTHK